MWNRCKVCIELYTSDGKVEKIIRTIRESILKSNEKIFIDKLAESIEKYNTIFFTVKLDAHH